MQTFAVRHLKLPVILDERGNLSVFENNQYFPFEMKWVSWLGTSKAIGWPSKRNLLVTGQVVILFSGFINVEVLHDGRNQNLCVDLSANCLYLPVGSLISIVDCSSNTSAFIASESQSDTESPWVDFFNQKKYANESAPVYH